MSRGSKAPVKVAAESKEVNLDRIDLKILTVLQHDATLSIAQVSDRAGLSITPCWKRIRRLEKEGVLLRRVALLDEAKVGLGLSAFIMIESNSHSECWSKRFVEQVSAMPEVMDLYRMAGDIDYLLRVAVVDAVNYDSFCKRLRRLVPAGRINSSVTAQKIKAITALPIPGAPSACVKR